MEKSKIYFFLNFYSFSQKNESVSCLSAFQVTYFDWVSNGFKACAVNVAVCISNNTLCTVRRLHIKALLQNVQFKNINNLKTWNL